MNKKTILEIGLYAQYYKKDIFDKYMINNKSLIITNDAIDILDKPQEKLYIEPWTKTIEKDKEIERLTNIINELEKTFVNDDKIIKEHNIEHPERPLDNYSRYYLDKLKELKEGK